MSSERFQARIVRAASGEVVAGRVVVARSLWGRLRGLLACPMLEGGDALWLEPCNGIHTFGMRYPLAAIVLDAKRRVLAVTPVIMPGRVLPPVRGGRITVEMLPGTLASALLTVGDALELEPL